MNKGEHYEQVTFFDWVRLNIECAPHEGVRKILKLCYAVPNGANLPKKKTRGKDGKWKTWSPEAKWLKAEGALISGFPDINLDMPVKDIKDMYAGLRIEMKHGKGVLSDGQKEKKELLEWACFKYAVCYSAAEAVRAVFEYLPFIENDYQGVKEFLKG